MRAQQYRTIVRRTHRGRDDRWAGMQERRLQVPPQPLAGLGWEIIGSGQVYGLEYEISIEELPSDWVRTYVKAHTRGSSIQRTGNAAGDSATDSLPICREPRWIAPRPGMSPGCSIGSV